MKRLFILLLALITVISLTACGSSRRRDRDDDDDEETTESTDSTVGTEGSTDSTVQTESPVDDDDEDEEDKADGEYEPGIRDDDSWESEYADLRFSLPTDMMFATEDEMENIFQIGVGMVAPDGNEDEYIDYANMQVVYEFMAYSLGTDNIIVYFEKVMGLYDEEAYLTAVEQTMSGTDLDYEFSQVDEVTIGGSEFSYFTAETNSYGKDMFQIMAVRKIGDRMLSITVTADDESEAVDMLDLFTAY